MVRPKKLLAELDKSYVHRRLDAVFGRKVLGAVFVGTAATQIAGKAIVLATGGSVQDQLVAWMGVFALAVAAFVWWDRVEKRAEKEVGQAATQARKTGREAVRTAEKLRSDE